MTTYLHNTCHKFSKDLVRTFEIGATRDGRKKPYLFLKIDGVKIGINVCPYCGQTAKEIIDKYHD